MRRFVAMGAVMMLSACIPPGRGPVAPEGPAPAGRPVPIEGDSITYRTGPCFGACPVYSVTVRPDGSGVFTGTRFTAVAGERRFALTRAQYMAFAARLAPWRPQSGSLRYAPGSPNCRNSATDMPAVDVNWTHAAGDSQNLYFYFGCDMERNRAMRDALGSAPDVLPIEALIGAQP